MQHLTQQAHTQQLLLNLQDDATPSLDNFVVGANAQAVQALRACTPGRALYLWGPPGVGRSHLLRALGTRPRAHYSNAGMPATALQRLATDETQAYICVAVDEVERLGMAAQAALFALYNHWRAVAATRQAFFLVVAGDRAPRAMSLREDLRTRLGWDLVFRLEPLSDQDRIQALQARVAQRALSLPVEVLQWLLTYYSRDMRHLSAVVDALDRYSLQTLRPITLPLLKTVLRRPDTHLPADNH